MTESAIKAVVIGASAGGVEALMRILPELPGNYPMPVCVVLHVPPDKDSLLADIFTARCQMPAHEAEDKQHAEAGHIYFAPPNYHLLMERDGSLSLSGEEPEFFSRPSIDALFESAADACGKHAIGVILTGGNEDGAKGLNAIASQGGRTLVQNTTEAATPAMPLAALAACPTAEVATLADIARILQQAGEAA